MDKEVIKNLNSIINEKNIKITELGEELSSIKLQVLRLQDQLAYARNVAKKVPQMQKELEQALEDRENALADADSLRRTVGQLNGQVSRSKPKGFFNRVLYLIR